MDKARELLARFKTRFGTAAAIYRAPGRVNLIGEHTDYNEGFVLPAAIGFSCWVAIASRDDRKLVLMVEIASRQRGVHGARMTGGGFGGCTINLVDAAESLEFQRRGAAEYESATGLHPDIYVCEASQGAEAINLGGQNGECASHQCIREMT
jgi:galactokinase